MVSYDPEIYRNVPLLPLVIPKLERLNISDILGTVGRVFVKHGVFSDFGFLVAHRHFDLDSDEILVDFDSSDGQISVALPWKFHSKVNKVQGPGNLDHFESFGLSRDNKGATSVLAMTWAFDSDGDIHPFEFEMRGDGETSHREPPPPAFVADLFATLKRLGVENIFGLRRCAPKFWETTDDAKRANISHFGDVPIPLELRDKMKVIYWSFNATGESKVNGICVGCTCSAHGDGNSCNCK